MRVKPDLRSRTVSSTAPPRLPTMQFAFRMPTETQAVAKRVLPARAARHVLLERLVADADAELEQ
jgi:hypothetical protein